MNPFFYFVLTLSIYDMKDKYLKISLNKAKEWYNSGIVELRELALQAFEKEELAFSFRDIKSLRDACDALHLNYRDTIHRAAIIAEISVATAAMFKLNIIRKALNMGQDLHLTKNPKDSYIYYPYNPFIAIDSTHYKNEIKSGDIIVIGEIKSEGTAYYVLGGCATFGGGASLGGFDSGNDVGYAVASVGFLGCASKEIAQHFGKWFGMLITEAKYGDMVDIKIISRKKILE